MMHPHLPGPRPLAVPGIGFPQNISVGPEVLDPAAFRDLSEPPWCLKPIIDRIVWTAVTTAMVCDSDRDVCVEAARVRFRTIQVCPKDQADTSPGRLLMRQTACARRSLGGMIGGGTRGREPPCPA